MEQELMDLLMSSSDIAVAVSDADGRIVVFSPGFKTILGEVHPRTVAELTESVVVFDEKTERRLMPDERPLTRALRGEVVRDLVVTARHTDGTRRYPRFNTAPVRGPGGAVRGGIALVQDVSIQHRQQVRQTQLRERLITTINHHFRTPLTLVLGNIELLEEFRPGLPPHAQRGADALTRGADELHDLIRAVSELVELDAAQDLRVRHGDLGERLQREMAAQEGAAAARGVTVCLEVPAHLMVSADLGLLQRAAGALIRNAIQHAPSGSRVTIGASTSAGVARIAVTDQGPGIPAAEIDRLLHPFETVEDAADKPVRLGLGLALVETVATAHGGGLVIEPNHPTGLRAELRIPVAQPPGP